MNHAQPVVLDRTEARITRDALDYYLAVLSYDHKQYEREDGPSITALYERINRFLKEVDAKQK